MKFSSNQKNPWKDHWYTPNAILDIVREVLGTIALDPATSPTNPAKADHFFTPDEDGLTQQWLSGFFLNPPFSTKQRWIQKAIAENVEGIILVPSSCQHNKSTKSMVSQAASMACLGRVRFIPSPELIEFRVQEGLDPRPDRPQDDMILLYFGESGFRFNHILDRHGFPVYRPISLCRNWRKEAIA
jgi:phage N-6-adenine-methyltransferase